MIPVGLGWAKYNDALLAAGPFQRAPTGAEADAELAAAAFEAVYERAVTDGQPHASPYRELARRLYRCLREDLHHAMTPEFDPETLRTSPLSSPPEDGTTIEWVNGGAVPGEVVAILRFPRPGQPAHLRVAVGPRGAEFFSWLRLPAPPPGPLAEWRTVVEKMVWEPHLHAALAETYRRKTAAWLAGPDGSEWLQKYPPLDPWARALVENNWCRIYPMLNERLGQVAWPSDTPVVDLGLQWRFSETIPVRGLIDKVRFATKPESARGVYSLGSQKSAGKELLAAAALLNAAPGAALPRKIWDAAVAQHVGIAKETKETNFVLLACELLEWLPTAPSANLAAVRDWCAVHGMELLPSDEEAASEAAPEGDSDAVTCFSSQRREGAVWVDRYGLRGPSGETILAPLRAVSVGPPPPHFAELQKALASIKSDRLLASLKKWPQAKRENLLIYEVAEFFDSFWKEAGGDPPPRPLANVSALLDRMLEEGFTLRLFRPSTLSDFPIDWVRYDKSRPIRTGRVLRILQPGLVSEDGTKMVDAELEVE